VVLTDVSEERIASIFRVEGKIRKSAREASVRDVKSRLPHFLDNRLIDGGKVVSLTRRPPFTPKNVPRIFLVLISVRG
jgi:hypothetical protein